MAYTRVNWQNSPSHATPLSAENLNVMDEGIYDLDAAVTEATGDIADLETTVSGHTTSITGLQTTVGEHTTDISNIEDDVSGLQTTVSGHTTSIGNLQSAVATNTGNITTLQTAVGTNTEDITDLKEDLEAIVLDVNGTNLLNPANIITGKLYKVETGTDNRGHVVTADNSAFSCAYIDVEYGLSYITTGVSFNCYNADADGYATGLAKSASSSVANAVFDTTAINTNYNNTDKTTTRVYFSWRTATYPTESFMVNKGTTLLPYTPYIAPSKKLASDITVSDNQITEETYIVDVNGSGDYTNFMECLVDLADNTNKKTIYIKSGTYDIYEEIGGDDFVDSIPSDAESYWDYITIVPPNTRIVGIGGVVLQYLPESVPEIASTFISPLNITDGDVYVENIKIVCKNCRYGIHDQTRQNHPSGYNHVYKNVSVLKDSENGITGMAQAFGGGLTQGANLLFENCTFQSYRYAFSFHNAHNGFANIVIKNCAFKNLISTRDSYSCVRFRNVSGVQTHINVNISGSYLNDGISIGNETSTERPNAYDLTMVNCIGNANVTITSETNIYTPQIFNS